MSFDPGLKPGDVIDNKQLTGIFKCGTQMGMRKSNETNTLVLVSNHTKSLYEDGWRGDKFHYTGMGTLGDQSLTFMQNKTLSESKTNGVDVFLFEVHKKGHYTFVGKVDLAGDPYQEKQADAHGSIRNVWMFPLIVRGKNQQVPVPMESLVKEQVRREKIARGLSDKELQKRAMLAQGKPKARVATTTAFQRNPDVAMWAKRRANGYCQLCGGLAPFNDKDGDPYLECHHIIWLSKDGPDKIENTVALCPNCHRKMHVVNAPDEVRALTKIARQRG